MKPTVCDEADGDTAFAEAADYVQFAAAEALVTTGADVNARGGIGEIPRAAPLLAGSRLSDNPDFRTVRGHSDMAAEQRAQGGGGIASRLRGRKAAT